MPTMEPAEATARARRRWTWPHNGPAAAIGEVLQVDLPRPHNRVTLADSAQCLGYRNALHG